MTQQHLCPASLREGGDRRGPTGSRRGTLLRGKGLNTGEQPHHELHFTHQCISTRRLQASPELPKSDFTIRSEVSSCTSDLHLTLSPHQLLVYHVGLIVAVDEMMVWLRCMNTHLDMDCCCLMGQIPQCTVFVRFVFFFLRSYGALFC